MLSLIGSTGSIGKQTLQVLDYLGQKPVALASGRNSGELEQQCRKYMPKLAALADEQAARDLRVRLADTPVMVAGGEDAVCEAAAHPEAETTLIAAVGLAGLRPALAAIGSVRRLALANKESMVSAGKLIMERARGSGTALIPVDSELSAVFQCREEKKETAMRHITLTASGGPFYGRSLESMRGVTVEEALRHPTWRMGKKITIDSATLLNKGYEVFEAMHFFDMPASEISVLVHRDSLIHAAVHFADDASIYHLAVPDMRLPIQYALTYPDRRPSPVKPLKLLEKPIVFAQPDFEAFPCLSLAMDAAKRGGFAGAVLATAGEAAVERFLAGEIPFTGIAESLEAALEFVPNGEPASIDDVFAAVSEARAVLHI